MLVIWLLTYPYYFKQYSWAVRDSWMNLLQNLTEVLLSEREWSIMWVLWELQWPSFCRIQARQLNGAFTLSASLAVWGSVLRQWNCTGPHWVSQKGTHAPTKRSSINTLCEDSSQYRMLLKCFPPIRRERHPRWKTANFTAPLWLGHSVNVRDDGISLWSAPKQISRPKY